MSRSVDGRIGGCGTHGNRRLDGDDAVVRPCPTAAGGKPCWAPRASWRIRRVPQELHDRLRHQCRHRTSFGDPHNRRAHHSARPSSVLRVTILRVPKQRNRGRLARAQRLDTMFSPRSPSRRGVHGSRATVCARIPPGALACLVASSANIDGWVRLQRPGSDRRRGPRRGRGSRSETPKPPARRRNIRHGGRQHDSLPIIHWRAIQGRIIHSNQLGKPSDPNRRGRQMRYDWTDNARI